MSKSSLLFRILVPVCASIVLIAQTAMAGTFAVDLDDQGVALKGYDPVAYFADGKPATGSADHTASVEGATYHFMSADNRDQFLADPGKFTPAYGGFCALGVTRSMKIKGDPEAWKIVDDELYINSSPDALARWSEDIPGNIDKADEAWPEIKDMDPAEL
jgi:YHS domain-containing protein